LNRALKKPAVAVFGLAAWLGAASTAEAACDASQPNPNPIGQYVISGGEVYDKKTDLTWARCSVGQHWREAIGCVGAVRTMTWDEALQQSGSGWRVPTEEELVTLVSPSCKSPALNDEAFPGMDPQKLWYWSSSSCGASCPEHVTFEFGNSGNYGSRAYPGAVR
jgi:hypothetical protein